MTIVSLRVCIMDNQQPSFTQYPKSKNSRMSREGSSTIPGMGVPDQAIGKGKYSILRNEDNEIVSALGKPKEWSR